MAFCGERFLRRGFSMMLASRSATPQARKVDAAMVKNCAGRCRSSRKKRTTGTTTPMEMAPINSRRPVTGRSVLPGEGRCYARIELVTFQPMVERALELPHAGHVLTSLVIRRHAPKATDRSFARVVGGDGLLLVAVEAVV